MGEDLPKRATAPEADAADAPPGLRNEQTALLRQLADAVGHELAGPLTSATMVVELLLESQDGVSGETRNLLAMVAASLYDAGRTLRELRLLARSDPSCCSRVFLPDAIERVVTLVTAGSAIEMVTDLDPVELDLDLPRLYQLVYTMATIHIGGGSTRLEVACRDTEDAIELCMTGTAPTPDLVMRADLAGALRGQALRPALPQVLAEQIAAELGASFQVSTDTGMLTIARFSRCPSR